MRLLILAVLLAVSQTPSPVSRKTPDNSTDAGKGVDKQSKQDKNQPTPPPSSVKSIASNPNEKPAPSPQGANKQESVRVSELPAVAITRDWRDNLTWIFSGLLVGVGIGGVWAAVHTLRAIRRQAVSMRRQTRLLRMSTLASRRSANAAKKAAEAATGSLKLSRETAEKQLRAYVYVESAMVKFDRPGAPEAQVHYKNFGQTPAFDVQAWIHIHVGPHPLDTVLQPAPPDLPKGKEPPAPGRASVHVLRLNPPVAPELLPPFGGGQVIVYVHGEITYRDAFGFDRVTKYRLICGRDGFRAVPKKDSDGDHFTHYFMQADTEGNEAT